MNRRKAHLHNSKVKHVCNYLLYIIYVLPTLKDHFDNDIYTGSEEAYCEWSGQEQGTPAPMEDYC